MVRMGTVWDRTVDVLQGRSNILFALGALYLFVPSVISSAARSYATPGSGLAVLAGLLGFVASILLLMGTLAITAVASDPAVDQRQASAIAARRLLPAIGLLALVVLAAAIVLSPAGILLYQSGATYDQATGRVDMAGADMSKAGWAVVLTLVLIVLGFWLSAKIAPLFAVIVNERLGLGAYARAFRLTRGSTLRLIGIIILYAIVVLVVMAAATSVVGIVARLLLGSDAAATVAFIVAIVSAAVTAVATVVQSVFYAQFYVLARATHDPQPTAFGGPWGAAPPAA